MMKLRLLEKCHFAPGVSFVCRSPGMYFIGLLAGYGAIFHLTLPKFNLLQQAYNGSALLENIIYHLQCHAHADLICPAHAHSESL
jgi:hypothetical protein